MVLWLGSGTGLTESVVPGASMGAAWTADGVGDFNGDGNADLLWTNASGQAAIWEMNGSSLAGFGVSAGQMGLPGKLPALVISTLTAIRIFCGRTPPGRRRSGP